MNKILDQFALGFAIFAVMFTGVGTYAFLNVITRPEMITVAIEIPQHRVGIVTMWDLIDPEGDLTEAPEWYHDYEAEQKYYNEPTNTFENMQAWTAEDHVCMAKNIYFEARNESLQGKIAIALVTMRRVQDPRWPNTVCGVVYQNKQFSWYSDGLSDRPRNQYSFDRIALIASAMLSADTRLYDFTNGSTHYHADYVAPYWTRDMIKQVTIDTHIFYNDVVNTTASL